MTDPLTGCGPPPDPEAEPKPDPGACAPRGERIRVRGLVQGVGFRPTVWTLARALGLRGTVRNDGDGVLIRAWGDTDSLGLFAERLRSACPPLARVDSIERVPLTDPPDDDEFVIVASAATEVHTGIVPDAATCEACAAEVADPSNRRYRYPFTNCTHCGPRLSIVRAIPYDRANTSMSVFPMCPACGAEYGNPADRRFHAQPNACPVCGPRAWLVAADGSEPRVAGEAWLDAVDGASRLLAKGRIIAIKGVGGFHLACDAADADTVAELRRRKRRWAKPFALMARDLDVIGRYCRVSEDEAVALKSPAAPIVLLDIACADGLAPGISPGQDSLGFMLPYSPLHRLLLARWDRPLVMTSGNISDEPQCTDNDDCGDRLGALADAFLLHDRAIVNRVDDSVTRIMDGSLRMLRRARGYAPAPLPLPPGFEEAPPVLAMGGELKSTICLLRDGQAVLSQHLGDLEDARTAAEYARTVDLYRQVFNHSPSVVAIDLHPNYRASVTGRAIADAEGVPVIAIQHHRAHVASVLADNGWPLDGGPVVGVALDGSGYGDDGSIWGGEWLVGDYRSLRRVGHLRRTALPGGTRAILEPWRTLFAHIVEHFGWDAFLGRFGDLGIAKRLSERRPDVLNAMIERGLNTPRTSSCGRLFDAVAAALGICADGIVYEGQAAIELEALCRRCTTVEPGYRLAIVEEDGARILDSGPMWSALFADLSKGVAPATIAARFHAGVADAVTELSCLIAADRGIGSVALSGGVFQNRTLFERVCSGLRGRGLRVLSHRLVPMNDGGLALGQAVVAAAMQGGGTPQA
ncbi:MAG: carbamoyltransferase HypF [Thiohalocapsa sp.]|nr:carbamoyltransferase HypF [Thiohalocapsa sp.]